MLSVLEEHCKSSLSAIPIDLVSLGDLPDDFKKLFTKLMAHVYSLKSKSRELVLKVLKVFADFDIGNDAHESSQLSPSHHDNVVLSPNVTQVFLLYIISFEF